MYLMCLFPSFPIIALHLNEVAGKCHTCQERVRILFIGKYCVRFGSDIHQFCSNTCLECYKTKIKVCCYCQKNLDKVEKVTSTANKVRNLFLDVWTCFARDSNI